MKKNDRPVSPRAEGENRKSEANRATRSQIPMMARVRGTKNIIKMIIHPQERRKTTLRFRLARREKIESPKQTAQPEVKDPSGQVASALRNERGVTPPHAWLRSQLVRSGTRPYGCQRAPTGWRPLDTRRHKRPAPQGRWRSLMKGARFSE